MDSLTAYVKTIAYGAILSGILLAVASDTENGPLIKLVCGIFLTIVALRPLSEVRLPDIPELMGSINEEAERTASYGEAIAGQAMADIIKQKTEAYILDKASAMGLALSAEITVWDGMPEEVRLEGDFRDAERATLSDLISQELGIPKENQQWIGCE